MDKEFIEAAKRIAQLCEDWDLFGHVEESDFEGDIPLAALIESNLRTVLDYDLEAQKDEAVFVKIMAQSTLDLIEKRLDTIVYGFFKKREMGLTDIAEYDVVFEQMHKLSEILEQGRKGRNDV